MPFGPYIAYKNALLKAADKYKESVPVTKDVMKVKSLFADYDFKEKLQFVVNDYSQSMTGKADSMVELMQPLESTVLPKFVTFLAKKRRLQALKPMMSEYMDSVYDTQNIVPVSVVSAQPLTEEQKEAIKAKMKARTGASDIKLACSIDTTLLAGLKITYNFLDRERMDEPTEGMDLSMRTFLEAAALDQGIVTLLRHALQGFASGVSNGEVPVVQPR